MNGAKPDLRSMHRLLHCHQWTNVEEWGQAIGTLADLDDAQIDVVVQPDGSEEDAAPKAAETR